jgi:outer membrane protein OmpA-like peptidoglycan-associated protein
MIHSKEHVTRFKKKSSYYSGRFYYIIIFFLIICSELPAQVLKSAETDYVVVTVPQNIKKYEKNKKLRRFRPLFYADSNVYFQVTQMDKFPKNWRKLKMQYTDENTGEKESWSFRQDTILDFVASRFRGRLKHHWLSLASGRLNNINETVSVSVRQNLFKNYIFATDTVSKVEASSLPAIDMNPCKPYDRLYARKQLNGYGLDQIRYSPYSIQNRKIIRKSFDVYFEKDKSTINPDDLSAIIDYIRNNNLSILNLSIEGYSSVEGDSARNVELHKRRAKSLISILQRYNNEPITRDTVIYAEAWDAFRLSIVNTKFSGMLCLTNAQIRSQINSDKELLYALEPYLKSLRRGKLMLTLAGKFTNEELMKRLKRDFNQASKGFGVNRHSEKAILTTEWKMLGIIKYADQLQQQGQTTYSDLAKLVDECPYNAEARILLFYHMIKTQEMEHDERDETVSLDSLFKKRHWNNSFLVANVNLISLLSHASTAADRIKRMRQANDVQYYTIKYIEGGLLDPAVLCEVEYPNQKMFHGLKLNHYAIAYKLWQEGVSLPCYGFPEKKDIKFAAVSTDEMLDDFIERADIGDTTPMSLAGDAPSFDLSEKGDYYYFIKTLFFTRDKSILEFVNQSDNHVEFDLYNLLRMNVDNWDPIRNHFYDADIQIPQMYNLISNLRSRDRFICRIDVNQLYLDFYVKCLNNAKVNDISGNGDKIKIADASLSFLQRYYVAHAKSLFPKLTLYVSGFMNSCYHLPTRKASTQYAYPILREVAFFKMLSDKEREQFDVYKKMYAK